MNKQKTISEIVTLWKADKKQYVKKIKLFGIYAFGGESLIT